MAATEHEQREDAVAAATVRLDEALVGEGELAHADEIIQAPDAAPVYPPELRLLFSEWSDDLAELREDLQIGSGPAASP